MLKRLRRQFIALIMGSVAVVLIACFGTIVAINYQQSQASVDTVLESAIVSASESNQYNHGPFDENSLDLNPSDDAQEQFLTMPPTGGPNGETTATDEAATTDETTTGDTTSVESPQPITTDDSEADSESESDSSSFGRLQLGGGNVIPVAVYSINDEGSLISVQRVTTGMISDDDLNAAAQIVVSADDGRGTLDDLGLYYLKQTQGEQTLVAFVDMSMANGWQKLIPILIIIGIVALLAFFLLSLAFSKWALRPVQHSWDQQRQFVADASHELKTPLTVILANASILKAQGERSVASQSQWIESTETEALRMQGLVADMLELAKLQDETPVTKKEAEQVNLSDLIEGDLLQFESVAFERGVLVDSQIDADVTVMGNTARLHRLSTTLIDNACKYAGDNGLITVTLRKSGKNAVFSVNNTGSLIAAEDLPHLFDRFYRTDKARNAETGGYGLGLAIAREVAEEFGGSIKAESTAEAGTTFTATLPLA